MRGGVINTPHLFTFLRTFDHHHFLGSYTLSFISTPTLIENPRYLTNYYPSYSSIIHTTQHFYYPPRSRRGGVLD